jgi:hypothetical protein
MQGADTVTKLQKSGQMNVIYESVAETLPRDVVPSDDDLRKAIANQLHPTTSEKGGLMNTISLGLLGGSSRTLFEAQQAGIDPSQAMLPIQSEFERRELTGQLRQLGVTEDLIDEDLLQRYKTAQANGVTTQEIAQTLTPLRERSRRWDELTENQKRMVNAGGTSSPAYMSAKADLTDTTAVIKFERQNESREAAAERKRQIGFNDAYPSWLKQRMFSAGLETGTPELWVDLRQGNRQEYNRQLQKVKDVWPQYGRALDEAVTWLSSDRGGEGAQPITGVAPARFGTKIMAME